MAEAPIIAVSDKSGLQVVCRLEEPITDVKGVYMGKKRRLIAQFTRGGAPDWVLEEAQKRFNFSGRGDGEPISMMVGVFDSAEAKRQWNLSDEEHDAIVKHLTGTQNPYWFIAEQPKIEAPWPTYDKVKVQGRRTAEHVAEKNVEIATEIGADFAHLIAYERQNRNDETILAAYEAAAAAQVEQESEELVEA